MPEVCMNERMRMMIVFLVLMKVLEGCLNERKPQHDVHHDGDEGPHTAILHVAWKERPCKASLYSQERTDDISNSFHSWFSPHKKFVDSQTVHVNNLEPPALIDEGLSSPWQVRQLH